MNRLLVASILVMTSLPLWGQSVTLSAQLNLMPMPSDVSPGVGRLLIGPSFSVGISGVVDPILQKAAHRFLDSLRSKTGMVPLDMKLARNGDALLMVHAETDAKEVTALGEDESYSLVVTPSGAKLEASTTLGALHGLETFLQLVEAGPDGFYVREISIQDKPRFPWRGLMIDAGRHFIPLNVLKRNLDGMAAVKLNVFHWHLSENQGFRVESKKLPRLHEMGSDDLYYTQAEVKDLIFYAHDRGIRVVPEFDMPGHTTAWFVGYPELASAPGPYTIERKWGVFDPAMNPAAEGTYKFLDEFVGEMAKLFPDRYFHIGGDEVNGKQWDANPKVQAFMRSHGMKSNADLQAYFNTRIQKILVRHGKTMVGWDEIMRPELPKDTVIQSWRGPASLAGAAKQGYRGLLSSGYYLDLIQPASQHYAADPLANGSVELSAQERDLVLGGEACMWSEYVSPENVDSRIWPRAAAVAERLWSPASRRDANEMYRRLAGVSKNLDWIGLTHNSSYAPMLERIAGSANISALRILADVVEPVKGYSRGAGGPTEPTSTMPLNRLIDAVRPESTTAREFSVLTDSIVAGQGTVETKRKVESMLLSWRDNYANLQLVRNESHSFLLEEVLPASAALSDLAETGVQAMDFIERGEHAPDDWREKQIKVIQQASQPKAQVLIMIAPSIRKLVETAAK